jgi:recombination protein RecA
MSQAMRKLNAAIGRSNTTVIFTNQLRSKIGVVYGNPETTTGGNALKYYASLRIDVRRKDVIKDGQEIVGNRVRAKIVKNKVAPPFREAEFDIMYNEGISRLGDMIDVAVETGIIVKSGSWFSFNEERVQGRDGMRKLLTENTPLYNALDAAVRHALKLPDTTAPANSKK